MCDQIKYVLDDHKRVAKQAQHTMWSRMHIKPKNSRVYVRIFKQIVFDAMPCQPCQQPRTENILTDWLPPEFVMRLPSRQRSVLNTAISYHIHAPRRSVCHAAPYLANYRRTDRSTNRSTRTPTKRRRCEQNTTALHPNGNETVRAADNNSSSSSS